MQRDRHQDNHRAPRMQRMQRSRRTRVLHACDRSVFAAFVAACIAVVVTMFVAMFVAASTARIVVRRSLHASSTRHRCICIMGCTRASP